MTAPARPLLTAKRQATIDHILTAARRLVVARGLDVTMEQIAEAADVSRRTLFRLFDGRDQLIASAFLAGVENYAQELPAYSGDRDPWLRATCEAAHRQNASFGPGYWELTSRSNLPRDLAAAQRERLRMRREMMARVARVLWRASGGDSDPPGELVDTVGAHLSAHFTAAVIDDAGREWQVASQLAYDAIMSVLRRLAP